MPFFSPLLALWQQILFLPRLISVFASRLSSRKEIKRRIFALVEKSCLSSSPHIQTSPRFFFLLYPFLVHFFFEAFYPPLSSLSYNPLLSFRLFPVFLQTYQTHSVGELFYCTDSLIVLFL